jgi:hypothetical protein
MTVVREGGEGKAELFDLNYKGFQVLKMIL